MVRSAEELVNQLRALPAAQHQHFRLETRTQTILDVVCGEDEWTAELLFERAKTDGDGIWPMGVRVVVAGKPQSVWTTKVMGEAKFALLRLMHEHSQIVPLIVSLLEEIRHRVDQGPLTVAPGAFPLVNVVGMPVGPSVVQQVGVGRTEASGYFPIRLRSF